MAQGANIFLVGFAGCGKSTAGKVLAGKLRRPFLDTDREVEKLAGMSLEKLFRQRGQAIFRRLEWQVLTGIAPQDRAIIAAGATVFLSAPHRRLVKERGVSVWLDVPFEEIWRRLENMGTTRLAERRRLEETFLRRRKIYALADLQLAAGGQSAEEIAQKIFSEIKQKKPAASGAAGCGLGD